MASPRRYGERREMMLPDFKDRDGKWVVRARVNGTDHKTISGSAWNSMMKRADLNGEFQKKSVAYRGVTASDEFKDFQTFCDWYTSQVGYGEGYAIDKDFLFPSNREYRPDRCVLIPAFLNNFCHDRAEIKPSGLPRGVHRSMATKESYYVSVCHLRSQRYVGCYGTAEEAMAAYRKAKAELAREIALDFITAKRPLDQRVIDILLNWEMPEHQLAKKGGA